MLWVFEGFTSHVYEFMLQASGVINKASYLKLLAEQINRYYQTPGRAYQSVAESSFDAWIKLYRNDENTGNAGISYYNKGALVALCLDLTLLEKTKGRYRLFDVIQAFYRQAKQNYKKRIGISSADMGAVISQFMSLDVWQDFERRYVNGVEALPIQTLLSANGVKLHVNNKETVDKHMPWGMRCSDTPAGLKVNRVLRGSAAARAGISAHDVIVAIDGIKADAKQLSSLSTSARKIDCHLFRRDELMSVTVLPKAAAEKKNAAADIEQDGLYQDSLHQDCPYKVTLHLATPTSASPSDEAASPTQAGWHTWLNVWADR